MRLLSLLLAFSVGISAGAVPFDRTQTDFVRHMEAQRRAQPGHLDADSVHSYDMILLSLDYRVEPNGQPLTGFAQIRLAARQTLTQIPLNAQSMNVQGVNVYDQAVPFMQVSDTLYVLYTLAAGDTATFDIQVSVPSLTGSGNGFHSEADHAYTFSEPNGARLWIPCFDQPFDKFEEVTIAVNMPDNWSLASNGALVETTYPALGRKREVYYHDHPITTYLVMFAAGDFAKRYETVNGILYRYFTFRDDSLRAANDWQRTPQMVSVYESMFGAYPFEQYGMVQTYIMNGWGAMEHQTFATFGWHLVDSQRTYEGVVAHELSHMWFGDDVTCLDFRNIWLNEGFATYSAALFYQRADGEQVFESAMQAYAAQYFNFRDLHNYAAYDPPPEYLFSELVYQKAAWVLHMLREQVMGDSLFFAALRSYVTQFGGGNANTEDFISAVNATYRKDLRWFFDQWIYQPGHPILSIAIQPRVPTNRDVTVIVTQMQSVPTTFRIPVSVDVQTVEGTQSHFFWVEQRTQRVVRSFSGEVSHASLTAFQPLLAEFSNSDAAEYPTVVREIQLEPVYPNPFNAAARIPFMLPNGGRASLRVFDVTGRLVTTLANKVFPPGRHEIFFGTDPELPSGVYWITLESDAVRKVTKALLIK
jgi:aminopeptidase N